VCELVARHRLADLEAVARSLADLKASDEPDDIRIKLLSDIRQVFAERQADPVEPLFLLRGDALSCKNRLGDQSR